MGATKLKTEGPTIGHKMPSRTTLLEVFAEKRLIYSGDARGTKFFTEFADSIADRSLTAEGFCRTWDQLVSKFAPSSSARDDMWRSKMEGYFPEAASILPDGIAKEAISFRAELVAQETVVNLRASA